MPRVLQDRKTAGRELAAKIAAKSFPRPLILGLPRGGVVVAGEVARTLQAPLDTLIVRKLGAPLAPELGFGAISSEGTLVLEKEMVRALGLAEEVVQAVIEKEYFELERRQRAFKSGNFIPAADYQTIILVDDGLATGVTARAAVAAARKKFPQKIIVLAVPVCAADTARKLRAEADWLICLLEPENLAAIGEWYQDFEQVPDEEVLAILEQVQAHNKIPKDS